MIQLNDLLAAGGVLCNVAHTHSFSDLAYDSRLTRPGELFIALRTARADGHDYIADALAAGASGVLCTWPPASTNATIIQTDDPLALLQRWAAARLRYVSPLVVAVTGSVGKTSTRHAIATLLATHGQTFYSRQSFNSLLGLPIALAHLRDDDRYAILEFGTDRFGEIAQLAQLFPPRIAVVTNIGDTHLDAFVSLAGVAREKGSLVRYVPSDGWVILNGDDPHASVMRHNTDARVLTFGQGSGCDVRGTIRACSLQGTHLQLHWQNQSSEAFMPMLGEPALYTALAATAVALACNMRLEAIAPLLAGVEPQVGRLHPLMATGGATLIDDSFNAALPSLRAALKTLAELPARRRIVILGEPTDVHANAGVTYTEIGALAGTVADHLICKGDWGIQAVQAARRIRPNLTATVVHTADAVLRALPDALSAGDLLLVKGNVRSRMERIAAALLHPQVDATQVLARQEAAWRTVRIGAPDRPTWVRIDLDAIAHNVHALRVLAGVPLIAVLKADAYGHGALRVARTVLMAGAQMLAVATLGEARALRQADITAPILVLGYTPPWQAREAVALAVTCTIFDADVAQALADAARDLDRPALVHVKVDTGMARLGLQPDQAGAFLQMLAANYAGHGLRVEGLYTHFATADSADETFARSQLERFIAVEKEIVAAGLRPPLIHAANSAATLRFAEARFDMVRPGIACYGLHPAAETPLPADFRPALSFHSEVAQVKHVPTGTPLSYGGIFVTRRPSQIATIPVGYADGMRRAPPWREVLLHGQRAPVVGRICMDYAMIDVTDIPGVKRGDAVTLIGSQGQEYISADEVAGWLGTINYEVVSTILPRVPREVEE